MKRTLHLCCCVSLLLVFNFVFATAKASAQGPLPVGSVSGIRSVPCLAGFLSGASCFEATVSCPDTLDIRVDYGVSSPSGVPRGTVAFFGGVGGTDPYGGAGTGRNYAATYLHQGYQIVQSAWETDWEDTGITVGKNVRTAACRPATLLSFFHQDFYDGNGGMCAQGISAGSAAIAYTLSWYGGADYLDKVELLSGPVFSDIEEGCAVPRNPPVAVCSLGQFGCVGLPWSDRPQYVQGQQNAVSQWTGHQCLQGVPTQVATDASWKAMSIVNGSNDPSFFFPQTAMAGWLCSNGLNNSAAEGEIYYRQFANRSQVADYSVTRVDNCAGSEGVDSGTTPTGKIGFIAIVSDMLDPVAGCIKRH